ncbi:MAG: hypothetical protein ACRD3W_19790, partial [Terriglobales bacterium]
MPQALVTYLEMHKFDGANSVVAPREDIRIVREPDLSVQTYRFLQKTIGEQYLWTWHTKVTDDEIEKIIRHPDVDIYLLYCGEEIAGFCEQDRRQLPNLEIKFFGLLPE